MIRPHRTLRLTALAALLALPACDGDFLTEVPSDFVSPENFYRNEGDALAAVNAAYASFVTLPDPLGNSDYVGRNFWMLTEYPTEVTTSRLSAANERSLIGNFNPQFTSSHPYLESVWAAAYSGINRANTVLGRVPDVPMDATRRDQILAEAKFLRALHYYWLAGLFGGVPLKLEETREIGAAPLPRATAAETWAQIATDLQEAAAVLPTEWPDDDFGRATRGAALTLLGKAYLQSAATVPELSGNHALAEQAFRDVMALGYTLDPDYASLFDGSNERSSEIIFSLQNIRVDGLGGRITEWFAPRTSPSIYQPGAQNQFQAERPFFDSYDPNDVRKAGTWLLSFTNDGDLITWEWVSGIQSSGNYGSTGPVPVKYTDFEAPDDGVQEPDYVLLRHADVLLSLAEAINATAGPTGEAYGYVDQVRARAGIGPFPTGLSAADFADSLYVERRRELAMEMHGIFDMRRNWDFAESIILANMVLSQTINASPFTSSVEKYRDEEIRSDLEPKWVLYPIPVRACELNPELSQNPGWEDGICQ